ncbi:hypothetical protein HNR37_001825 [Desulfurispira natronophila]|uniref:Uncharacterized protein n=1 Tax=Desulfurispira natronophila TaxID=682562 RepID=A0A7W8DHP0_9BACT|nr:hypothetical protein [Desulfurispira natronophila]
MDHTITRIYLVTGAPADKTQGKSNTYKSAGSSNT